MVSIMKSLKATFNVVFDSILVSTERTIYIKKDNRTFLVLK